MLTKVKKVPTNDNVLFTTKKFSKLMSLKFESDSSVKLTTKESRFELANFLYQYFLFIYYLGSCPFRFTKDPVTGCFQIKTWKPQQLICAFLTILCVFRYIGMIRYYLPSETKHLIKNPTPYFGICGGVCAFLYKMVTLKRFWMNQKEYLKILNVIATEANLINSKTKITKPYFSYVGYGLVTLQVVVCFVGGYSFIDPIWTWSPSWWLRRLVEFGRYTLCFGNSFSYSYAPHFSKVTVGDWITTVFMVFAEYERLVIGFFSDICIFSSAITLWIPASSFATNIEARVLENSSFSNDPESQITRVHGQKGKKDQEWKSIYKKFQAIQNLSAAINAALGAQVTLYMAEGLMYYSIKLNSIFISKDWFKKINVLIFYFTTGMIMLFSADVCKKVETIKVWMTQEDNIKNVPPEEANLVLHELMVKDIGIKGSNVFTLTYPLVATFLSLIITFFIICIQQNANGDSTPL